MTLNQIRIARPVSDLLLCSNMYCYGLGLEQIAQFADRDGFSEVMIGRRDLSCILNSPTAIIIQWRPFRAPLLFLCLPVNSYIFLIWRVGVKVFLLCFDLSLRIRRMLSQIADHSVTCIKRSIWKPESKWRSGGQFFEECTEEYVTPDLYARRCKIIPLSE